MGTDLSQADAAKAPFSSEEGVGGGGPPRKVLLERAATMRRNPTEPERRLWNCLRDSRLSGFKFRRQAIVGNRIADFFCPAKGLLIELDGETHDREGDLRRDVPFAARSGFHTLRVTNEDVMRNLDGVLVAVLEALHALPGRWTRPSLHHPPTPSSEEEGELDA